MGVGVPEVRGLLGVGLRVLAVAVYKTVGFGCLAFSVLPMLESLWLSFTKYDVVSAPLAP